jgi:putative ABC transport system permease protein
MLLRLAARNVRRNTRRSLLCASAVGLAVALLVITPAYMHGLLQNVAGNIVRTETGHVRIVTRAWWEEREVAPLDLAVEGLAGSGDPSDVVRLVEREIPDCVAVAPRIVTSILFSPPDGSGKVQPIVLVGNEPEIEESFNPMAAAIVAGRMHVRGSREIVLGERFARRFGFSVGDRVTFLATTAVFGMNAMTFQVAGILRTGLSTLDDRTAFVSIDAARRFLDVNGVQEILVILRDGQHSREAARRLNELFAARGDPDLLAIPWEDQTPFAAFVDQTDAMMGFYHLLFVIMAGFVISNSVMMIVVERTREVGTMAALGVRGPKIVLLFLLESGMLAIAGSIFGLLLGLGVAGILSVTGLPLGGITGRTAGLPMSDVIYPVVGLRSAASAVLLGLLGTILFATLPSRRAAKLKPTEALRHA